MKNLFNISLQKSVIIFFISINNLDYFYSLTINKTNKAKLA